MDKVQITFEVTVEKSGYLRNYDERGTARVSVDMPVDQANYLDGGNLLLGLLPVAVEEYLSKLEEGETDEI